MSDVYQEAFYHLVWATKSREEMIVPRMESLLHSYIRQKCREAGAFVYALNGMPDHLHLVCSIPASLSASSLINTVKGASSHYINHGDLDLPLRWQPGYGLLTFAEHDLARLTAYVESQKLHQGRGRTSPRMERIASVSAGPVILSPGEAFSE